MKSQSEQAEQHSHRVWSHQAPERHMSSRQGVAQHARGLLQQETSHRGPWRCSGHTFLDNLKSGRPVTTREDGTSAWPAQLAPEVTTVHVLQSSALLAGADTRPNTKPEALMQIQKPKSEAKRPTVVTARLSHLQPLKRLAVSHVYQIYPPQLCSLG